MKTRNFVYDIILSPEDVCNLKKEQSILKKKVLLGGKLLVYGRRNTGKTSLIESIVIPEFNNNLKNCFIFHTDLLGVKDMEDLSLRLFRAFERAFEKAFPKKIIFQKMLDIIKGLRPEIAMDQQGTISVSIGGWSVNSKKPQLEKIFEQLRNLEKAGVNILVVLDEFQDVHFIKGADAMLRNEIQHLSARTSVILLGSKKHILSKIFTSHGSPFFNWGEPVEISQIDYKEYQQYMNERFARKSLKISLENSTYLQNLMQRIPEPINIVCAQILELIDSGQEISKKHVDEALEQVLSARKGKMEEYLSHFTESEVEVMIAIAKAGKVTQPSGKNFTRQIKASKPAISKIVNNFLNEAVLYKDQEFYELSDPLLTHHIKVYR
ncbi:MAG: hypothetical protein A2583_00170 [Bdellovibrionales bacterium RIFOXYD1_FULL_53_11]|nr:MAG: hypothetical protein A2583_00170 [Bdellovibrionales bacterium RIFOXYD1_FULL_53_11]